MLEINIIETIVASKGFRIESISKQQLNIILITVTAIVSCLLCVALIGVSLCFRKKSMLSNNCQSNSDSTFKSDHKINDGENNEYITADNRVFCPLVGPDVCELCITEPLLQQTSPVSNYY